MSDADDPVSYIHELAMAVGRELAMTAPTGVVFCVLMNGPVPDGRENSYTTNVDPAHVVKMLRAFADAIELHPECGAVVVPRPGPDIE